MKSRWYEALYNVILSIKLKDCSLELQLEQKFIILAFSGRVRLQAAIHVGIETFTSLYSGQLCLLIYFQFSSNLENLMCCDYMYTYYQSNMGHIGPIIIDSTNTDTM